MSSSEPLLLAVESATATLSLALLRGSDVIAFQTARPGAHSAETLLPLVEQVLAAGRCAEQDVFAYGVSIGPGSFTSLRVGLATVKGLAFATPRVAVAIPTLAALAFRHACDAGDLDPDEPIAALLDAHRGEVYAGLFLARRDGGEPQEIGQTGLFTPGELCDRLPSRCVLTGDGVAVLAAAGVTLPRGIRVATDAARPPSARAVGALAARALARGEAVDPADLVPRYVRRAQAEVTRTSQRVESTESPE